MINGFFEVLMYDRFVMDSRRNAILQYEASLYQMRYSKKQIRRMVRKFKRELDN